MNYLRYLKIGQDGFDQELINREIKNYLVIKLNFEIQLQKREYFLSYNLYFSELFI